MNTLSVKECLTFGWNTFKARPWFFVGTFALYAVVQILLSIVQKTLPGFVSFLLSMISSTLLYIGLITIYLKAHVDPKSPQFSDFWRPELFWKYLAASILLAVIVIVGLILLIVPGIFFALAFAFTGYLVVDKNMNPVAALKESARLTKGNRWKLLLLGVILVVLTILGAIPLFLGLLVIGPVSMLAGIHAYRVLEKAAGPVPVVSPATPTETPKVEAAPEVPVA
jgi:uncharacterized membrane protein